MKKIFYGWLIVFIGALILCFTNPFVFTINSLYVVPISESLGIKRSFFQLTATVTAASSIFSAIIVSRIINDKNIIKILVVSTLVLGVSFLSFAFTSNIYIMLILSFFIGFAYLPAGMIPVTIITTNWFDKLQGFVIGLALLGISLGSVLFVPVTNFLITNYSWQTSRLVSGVIYLIIIIPVIIFFYKPNPKLMGLKPYGYSEEKEEISEKGVKDYNKTTYYKLFIFGAFISGIVASGGMQNLPPFINDNFDFSFSATIVGVYSFSAIFGKIVLGVIHDRYGTSQSVIFGSLLYFSSFVLMAFFQKIAFIMIISALMFGVGNSVGSVNANLVTHAIFKGKNYSKVLSESKAYQQFGMALGPVFVSSFYDIFKNYKIAWIICALLVLILVYSWVRSNYLYNNKMER